jgi:hypothetical protein
MWYSKAQKLNAALYYLDEYGLWDEMSEDEQITVINGCLSQFHFMYDDISLELIRLFRELPRLEHFCLECREFKGEMHKPTEDEQKSQDYFHLCEDCYTEEKAQDNK